MSCISKVTKPDDLAERVFPFFERFALRGPKAGATSLCSEGSQHTSSQATICRRPVSEGSSKLSGAP